jgi:RNA polymerase sigma-70 factor (ECF subfamily)
MSDDLELFERARGGDAGAQERFDERWRARLVGFCTGYLGRRDDGEDAAQEVLLRAATATGEVRSLEAWLLRAARNHCLNVLRARRARGAAGTEPLPSELELARTLTGPLTHLARDDERATLAAWIARLSDEQRELLRLRYDEGLSRDAIAELCDLPPSTVKSRLYEATLALRRLAGAARDG